MLFNIKDAQTDACTGFFEDVTETPSTRLCPNGPPCFNESGFTTGAQIIDMNLDFKNDIVKSDADSDGERLLILYNDVGNVGHFDVMQDLEAENAGIKETYMFAAADMNGNLGVDLYVTSGEFRNHDRFLITKCFPGAPPEDCVSVDGKVEFRTPKTVVGGLGTFYNAGNVRLFDMDGDSLPDVLQSDLDIPGTSEFPPPGCPHWRSLTLLHTTLTTNPSYPLEVTVKMRSGAPNCAWNTRQTYDTAVMDINGDSKPDFWSGNTRGNHVFLQENVVDCDADGIPDRCTPRPPDAEGIENPVAACCLTNGTCIDTFKVCCDQQGGHFNSMFSCVAFGCFPFP